MVPKRIFMQLAMVHRICAVVQWNWISTRCKVPWASLGGGSWKMLDFGWNFWRGMWNWNELKQTGALARVRSSSLCHKLKVGYVQQAACDTSSTEALMWCFGPENHNCQAIWRDMETDMDPGCLGHPKRWVSWRIHRWGPRKRSTVELQWNLTNPPGPCEKKWLCKEQWGKSRPALLKLSYHHLIR